MIYEAPRTGEGEEKEEGGGKEQREHSVALLVQGRIQIERLWGWGCSGGQKGVPEVLKETSNVKTPIRKH